MGSQTRKLLTVITEAVLEKDVCADLLRLGAGGYTVSNARGSGAHGERGADWGSNSNVRIEVISSAELAETIAAYLHETYFADYAMIVFASDVTVRRSDKF